MWYLCSVPNLVQISVIVTEIDAHMLHLMTSRELTSGLYFWSRGHLRMAMLHFPIWFDARYLYPVQSYWHFSEIQDGADIGQSVNDLWPKKRFSRWRPSPSWIFSLCLFGHSIWRQQRLSLSTKLRIYTSLVQSVVLFVLCTKFGPNTWYNHWDRRTYASDLHLMTSRELTSGFDFWSRGQLRMAVVHLPI